MSDYLANLVMRTLSPSACLRPQLFSVFDPAPARISAGPVLDAGMLTESSSIEENTTPSLASPPGSPIVRAPVRQQAETLHRGSDPLESSPALDHSNSNFPSRPWTKPRSTPITTTREADRGIERTEVVSVPPSLHDQLPETSLAALEPAGPAPAAVLPKLRVASLPPAAKQQRSLTPRHSGTAPQPPRDTASIVLPAISTPTRGGETPLPVPAIRPVVRAASIISPQPLPAKGDVVPTIQVTIGRVEVRATPAPASQSRPKTAAKPAMSLEDYLRQRRSGGDR